MNPWIRRLFLICALAFFCIGAEGTDETYSACDELEDDKRTIASDRARDEEAENDDDDDNDEPIDRSRDSPYRNAAASGRSCRGL